MDINQLNFRKSSRCDNSGPNCVEVAFDGDGNAYVRNSTNPTVVIPFTPAEWGAFTPVAATEFAGPTA